MREDRNATDLNLGTSIRTTGEVQADGASNFHGGIELLRQLQRSSFRLRNSLSAELAPSTSHQGRQQRGRVRRVNLQQWFRHQLVNFGRGHIWQDEVLLDSDPNLAVPVLVCNSGELQHLRSLQSAHWDVQADVVQTFLLLWVHSVEGSALPCRVHEVVSGPLDRTAIRHPLLNFGPELLNSLLHKTFGLATIIGGMLCGNWDSTKHNWVSNERVDAMTTLQRVSSSPSLFLYFAHCRMIPSMVVIWR